MDCGEESLILQFVYVVKCKNVFLSFANIYRHNVYNPHAVLCIKGITA